MTPLLPEPQLRKRSHHREQESGYRRVLTGEGELLLDELDPHSPPVQLLDDASKVIQVASEPVYAVDDDSVTLTGELHEALQRREVRIMARWLWSSSTLRNTTPAVHQQESL